MADEKQQPGSRRMEILQRSLEKKQSNFEQRLQSHFDDVRGANGQPLNDKRNGRATLNRWERQNDGLRTAQKEIEKTQRAIEREQAAIDRVINADIPEFLKPMIESGEITQWRKFPNRFFVQGVEKARIIWDKDKQQFGYAYLQGVTGEQFAKFRDTYNHILALHRQEQERKNTPETEKPVLETEAAKPTPEKPAQQAEERSSENVSDDPKTQPAETYALFGKKAGEPFETFIADKVRFDDGGISPIDSRELAEHIKNLSEKDGYTDVRILAVRHNEKPDFVKAVQDSRATSPEPAVQQAETDKRNEQTAPLPSPEERLHAAKHRYLMQDTFLTQSERQQRQYKEYLMEKAVRDMPPDMQNKARANFYESQINETAKGQEKTAGEPGFELTR